MQEAPMSGWQRLTAVLAVAAIVVGLSMLLRAERGLSIVHTEVDGIPVTVFAPRDAPPAPAVLIGHGFAGSRQLMHPFAVTLARNGYVAVTFDFPGHGRNRTPLAGTLGEPERAEALLDAFSRVARYARSLPASDGRLATLGHSMAGDILVRYADIDPDVDAAVAVSPYLSRELGAEGQRNLLFVFGEYEPAMISDQAREAVAALAGKSPEDIELGVTYSAAGADARDDAATGDPSAANARRMIIADGVEHIGVLYSAVSQQAALDWINRVYGRTGEGTGMIDARGPWLGLFYLGVLLLAWPLSTLLPRVAPQPRGAALGWSRLLPLALVPALLTPLMLRPIPSDFLPIVIGDYIALHFGLYGLLTLCGLWLVGERPARLWQGVSGGAMLLAVLAVGLYETALVTLPTDRFVSAYLPGSDRLATVLVLFAGTLLWFVADEWLTRGGRARGVYALTKVLFVVSLMLAVALNMNELFFLVIIIPAILALFIIYGLFSGWIYRRTNYPLVAAVTSALAFASAITVSFPMIG